MNKEMISLAAINIYQCLSSAYGRDIEEDIIADTSGHFKKMLVVLLQVSALKRFQHQNIQLTIQCVSQPQYL